MKNEDKEKSFEVKWEREKLMDKLFPLNNNMSFKYLSKWAFQRKGARALFDYLLDNEVDLTNILNK